MAEPLDLLTGAILAGGLGTRLRSCVADRPKVLAPVRGRPYLTYLLNPLAAAGLRDVVLLTGYRAEQVRDALGERYGGMRLHYSVEAEPLGTGGAVRLALPFLHTPAVLLLNGDSYCDVDLVAFSAFHARHGGDASLVLCRVADAARFGRVSAAGDRIERFGEKDGGGPGWINAGVYLLKRDVIAALPAGRPISLERDILPQLAADGRLFGYRCVGRFLDIGTPESYREAEAFFHAA